MSGDCRRGQRQAIDGKLWPEMQARHRAGATLAALRSWLQDEHGLRVGLMTVSRTLDRIRVAAPPAAPEPPIELEPATDADELALLRKKMREESRNGPEWKQRHSAARLLLAVMEAQRAPKPTSLQPPQGTATTPAPPQTLTPEQEAELVRRELGELN